MILFGYCRGIEKEIEKKIVVEIERTCLCLKKKQELTLIEII